MKREQPRDNFRLCNIIIIISYYFIRKKPRHDSSEFYSFIPKGSGGLLSKEMEEISGLYYRPRTKESRDTYELLLTFIQKCIGDQVSPSIIITIVLT